MPGNLTWIDTHIHVSDIAPDGSRRPHLAQDLVAVLERSGADLRFLVSCDFPYLTRMATDPQWMWAANRMVHEVVQQAPGRLYGSCTVNPAFLEESLRCMEVCFREWGFVQLGEMLPYLMGYRFDSPEVDEVVRAAAGYQVPVQVHLGTYWLRGGDASGDGIGHIADLLAVAERVPEANYVLAHAIGCDPDPRFIPWANMYLDVLAGTFEQYPTNFWVEIRDFDSTALARTLAEVPTTRLLAGTDWTTRIGPPFQSYGTTFGVREEDNRFPPGVAAMVGFLEAAGASEEDVARIASGNARELYHLD
ncbi:MAG: amidohydrolase family protein [Anaerolineae bacterium]|nr:amidohydrolase family protein [Anaerolineae bacterium]